MKALKCDRCGIYYDTIMSYDAHAIGDLYLGKFTSVSMHDTRPIDLCPTCMNSLIKWLDNVVDISSLSKESKETEYNNVTHRQEVKCPY